MLGLALGYVSPLFHFASSSSIPLLNPKIHLLARLRLYIILLTRTTVLDKQRLRHRTTLAPLLLDLHLHVPNHRPLPHHIPTPVPLPFPPPPFRHRTQIPPPRRNPPHDPLPLNLHLLHRSPRNRSYLLPSRTLYLPILFLRCGNYDRL